ncbi:MAG: DUF5337 domain-containing protein [Rhodobacteraceae bacterium]|nr:DUF5337 domain-containing protein [Paracoccaceae bacterium]
MARKPQKVEYSERDLARARTGRMLALVIAGVTLVWLLAQAIGPRIGIAGEYAFFFDLAAMAGYLWAFIIAVRLWRAR